jgi:hypothetical protein
MSTGRLIGRAAVSAVASLALVAGTGAGTALAAEMTAAERCAVEKQDVKKAKKKVKKAKKAKNKAAKKVRQAKGTSTKTDDVKAKKAKKKAVKKLRKAKRKLQREKAQRNTWCAKAHDESSALTELGRLVIVFEQIPASGELTQLPGELGIPLTEVVTEVIEHLTVLETQIPGADPAVLTQLVTNLQALDPTALQAALEALAAQFTDPGSSLLASSLIGGVPDADLGELGRVQSALAELLAQLQAFDPAASGLPLHGIETALLGAAQALQDDAAVLEGVLAALTELNQGTLPGDPSDLSDLLAALAALNGGTVPTGDTLSALVAGLIAGEIPTDGLPPELSDVLDDALGDGLPGVEDLPLPLPLPDVPLDPELPELPGLPLPTFP